MKKILQILIFLTFIVSVNAGEIDISIMSKAVNENIGGIDSFLVLGTNYSDNKSSLVCIDYAQELDINRPGVAYLTQFNNPYKYKNSDGAQDIILLYKDKTTGKFYVGHYSIFINIGYSYPMVAFEFDDWNDARDVYFLWLYLKYRQATELTEVHFKPSLTDFWWDENGSYIYANIPKNMIDRNYEFYKNKGYFNAFSEDFLLMDDVWHDLSNGKTYKKGKNIYSSQNGVLYCNKKPAQLQNDINKMIRIYKYSNSDKFIKMLREGSGYYYCERCANNPYDAKLRPIEFYGTHYQGSDSTSFHKQKVAGICNTRMNENDWLKKSGYK